MNENLNKNKNFLEKIKLFFKKNKFKIVLLTSIVFITLVSIAYFNTNTKKKNILMSEKYIRAGLLLSKNQNEDAKNIYEEIIMSNNKFYSLLALNVILEKNLITEKKMILRYFEILEEKNFGDENLDLIIFKKALFLIKNSEKQKGGILLKKLIEKDSKLKKIAQEVIIK
tara:strand:+ start:1381 stop:1890 length:510 start_codon:yes stop_codon:yes gene_type:complete